MSKICIKKLLNGELRGITTPELLEQWGEPWNVEGDIWIYERGPTPEIEEGHDLARVRVTLWMEDDHVAHAYLWLDFHEGLSYAEIVF